jgi:serine/threonine protein kinase
MSAESPTACPRCNHRLRPSARFCDNCGVPLSSNENVTVVFGNEVRPHSESSLDPLLGRVIQSKYKILSQIGAGGMGRVYRAQRLHIGDEVVIKLLDRRYVSNTSAVERFRREAKAAARIRHPNVVVIHDFGEADSADTPAFIVMELVVGLSLKHVLRAEGPLSLTRTISIMREICRGVEAGHNIGVIHRDIKPDNIIVVSDDGGHETVKLVDFGLAKLRDEASDQSVTQFGALVGTPLYMSPEQCRGDALGTQSDVYSLGVLTYEMLMGRVPFSGNNAASICAKHQYEKPPPFPPELKSLIAVQSVVMRALLKTPNDRQESAADYANELQTARGEETVGSGILDSTLKDTLSETVTPAAAAKPSLHLTKTDCLLLSWLWQRAIQRGQTDHLELDYVLDNASQEGVTESDALESLESLRRKGFIERSIRRAEPPHFSLTSFGFDQYATAFIENYAAIKAQVARHLVQGDMNDNLSIAKATEQPRVIIDRILDLLNHSGLINVSKRLGGKLVVKDVSIELELRLPHIGSLGNA